jgi:broad specificity phosphatase PhoE
MKKIVAFFVRHGETNLNDPPDGGKERFRGDADVLLNNDGKKQAEALVPLFNAREFSAAFHSGMQRTAQTLEPLMKAKGMEAHKIDGLNSLNTGDFTGLPKNEENKKKLEYYRIHPNVRIPGGESVNEFRKRVDPRIMRIIHLGEKAGKPTIAAMHGSIMRELSRLLCGGDYNAVKVDPGGVVAVYKDSSGYSAVPILRESLAEEDIKPGS